MTGLTITRTFAAPRELVYDAWTSPEHFTVWFGGDTVSVPIESVAFDVRPGGTWRATMELPDGRSMNWVGEFLEASRPERLVMTITDDATSDERATITVDLVTVDAGTEMTMTQTGGPMGDEQYEMTKVGYQHFFDAMEALLVRLA